MTTRFDHVVPLGLSVATPAIVLTPSQSGSVFTQGAAGAAGTITLPLPAACAGATYTIVPTAVLGFVVAISSGAANILFTGFLNAALASQGAAAMTTMTLAATVGPLNTGPITLVSNGVYWVISGTTIGIAGWAFA